MKTKENYFLDTVYKCRTECIREGFWTEGRIAKEPFNGSFGVMDWIANHLGLKEKTLSLLDVGCGPASKLPIFFPKCKITGIDTKEAIALAKKNNPQGIFYDCNLDDDREITSVSEKLGKFDVILCIDVIEHVLFPEKMLRLIKKHLLPGQGEAYIATLERDISRGMGSGRDGSPITAHVREWNQDEFTRFVSSEGFLVQECKLTPLSMQPTEKTRHMRVQTLRCRIPEESENKF